MPSLSEARLPTAAYARSMSPRLPRCRAWRWCLPAPVAGAQLSLPSKWRTEVQHSIRTPRQPMLAVDKVRHVGEAVAVVVAESRYQAQDAAELVTVDVEQLAAVVDVEASLTKEAAIIHEEYASNLIGEFAVEKGQAAAAL